MAFKKLPKGTDLQQHNPYYMYTIYFFKIIFLITRDHHVTHSSFPASTAGGLVKTKLRDTSRTILYIIFGIVGVFHQQLYSLDFFTNNDK